MEPTTFRSATRYLFLAFLLMPCWIHAQDPIVKLKLSAAHPLQMPVLLPYALIASATVEEPATITGVTFTVDGEDMPANLVDGAYQIWWTPASYATHTVSVTATASNGSSATDEVQVVVTDQVATQTVSTLDQAVIDWGTIGSQWYEGSYELPQSIGAYTSISAHLALTCPGVPGGCDDWDRLAYVQIKAPSGRWVELIRYITPYGRACNDDIDLTDFASLLQGHVDIRMYIETWGTGGWKIDLDLTYEAGTPEFLYSTVQEVWHGTYPFGDPADLQPVDTVHLEAPVGTQNASLRLVTTGHGWGNNNSQNAAEFYHAVHQVRVNGQAFTQDLWNDCNPNPAGCSPQAGTWQYDRAGWCPGAISFPHVYALTSLLGGDDLEFIYTFQPSYVDQCHPNNPACISGTTCPDCNDGYNPHYPVSAYLIGRSNLPLLVGAQEVVTEKDRYALRVAPNPTSGPFTLWAEVPPGAYVATIHDVSGAALRTWHFRSAEQLDGHALEMGALPPGTYFLKLQGRTLSLATTLIRQ